MMSYKILRMLWQKELLNTSNVGEYERNSWHSLVQSFVTSQNVINIFLEFIAIKLKNKNKLSSFWDCYIHDEVTLLYSSRSDTYIHHEVTRVRCNIYRYTLRCTITDDWGKVRLAFDLEVVQVVIHKMTLVGVCRRRVKGDTWHYKKLCESILTAAAATSAVWWRLWF